MSKAYSRFFKALVLLIGLYSNADCATLFDYGFQRPQRRPIAAVSVKVDSFDRGSNPHTGNILIKSTSGRIAATIFLLQFGTDKGKIGAYLNISDSKKVEVRGFIDPLSAKKWVVTQAQHYGIALARA